MKIAENNTVCTKNIALCALGAQIEKPNVKLHREIAEK